MLFSLLDMLTEEAAPVVEPTPTALLEIFSQNQLDSRRNAIFWNRLDQIRQIVYDNWYDGGIRNKWIAAAGSSDFASDNLQLTRRNSCLGRDVPCPFLTIDNNGDYHCNAGREAPTTHTNISALTINGMECPRQALGFANNATTVFYEEGDGGGGGGGGMPGFEYDGPSSPNQPIIDGWGFNEPPRG